jgi:hypothetical protein
VLLGIVQQDIASLTDRKQIHSFMEPGVPSACSEEYITGSDPKAIEPNPHHHNLFILKPVLILSCDGMAIDGVWIGKRIYWTL